MIVLKVFELTLQPLDSSQGIPADDALKEYVPSNADTLHYIYGKGQNPNSILSQLERALENGETCFNMSEGKQLRDYLPVEKVAKYIVKIARQNRVTGIVNCGSGTPISIKKLVENYLKEKKKSVHLNLGYYPYPEYESMAFWGDTSKLRMALGE